MDLIGSWHTPAWSTLLHVGCRINCSPWSKGALFLWLHLHLWYFVPTRWPRIQPHRLCLLSRTPAGHFRGSSWWCSLNWACSPSPSSSSHDCDHFVLQEASFMGRSFSISNSIHFLHRLPHFETTYLLVYLFTICLTTRPNPMRARGHVVSTW